jgi:hypothetical protein
MGFHAQNTLIIARKLDGPDGLEPCEFRGERVGGKETRALQIADPVPQRMDDRRRGPEAELQVAWAPLAAFDGVFFFLLLLLFCEVFGGFLMLYFSSKLYC